LFYHANTYFGDATTEYPSAGWWNGSRNVGVSLNCKNKNKINKYEVSKELSK